MQKPDMVLFKRKQNRNLDVVNKFDLDINTCSKKGTFGHLYGVSVALWANFIIDTKQDMTKFFQMKLELIYKHENNSFVLL